MEKKRFGIGTVEHINKKRMITAAVIFAVLLILLLCRLFYIQIMCHNDLAEAAVSQYEISLEGMDTRGRIFDRNMKPITGGTYQYYYIIKNKKLTVEGENLLKELHARQLASSDSDYRVYRTETYSEEINEKLKEGCGAYVFASTSRYSDSQPACHLVGYLNESEKRGVYGLERLYEERLKADNRKLVIRADAGGNILKGRGPYIRGFDNSVPEDNSLVTSLELGLQKKCESLLEDVGSGACIVTDSGSGQVLAMASVPAFNPNRIPDYISDVASEDSDCLINKSLQAAYPPGSVFKLVVAAAALENGICTPEKKYECAGEAEVEGICISCSTAPEGGHGKIDMYEAMAKSCNCYFARLGKDIGAEKILEMAEKLGFGQTVLNDFPEENQGFLPDQDSTAAQDISNISIGQGQLLATPLQIARMTGIIANCGTEGSLSLTADYETSSASLTVPVSQPKTEEKTDGLQHVISPQTAETLQELMRGVMTEGTGFYRDSTIPVWGKSGTAEAFCRGKEVKDCWFTGFCDVSTVQTAAESAGTKRLVVTVFAEDGVSGSATALPIFREITQYMQKHTKDIM